MKLYNCPYKGDICFLYGNCEECAFHKAMEKNRGYRKTIKNLKFSCEQKDLEIKYLEMDKKQAVKDTAKEILRQALADTDADERFIHWLRERYGVEVE